MRPKLSTAPIRAGGGEGPASPVSTAPRTRRYDVEEHRCQAEDTWEKLSTRYYFHDRCAAALKAFNQNYFLTTALVRREGVLAPGERIYIPPLQVLMEQYDSLIRPAPENPTPAATPRP